MRGRRRACARVRVIIAATINIFTITVTIMFSVLVLLMTTAMTYYDDYEHNEDVDDHYCHSDDG